MVEVPEGIPSFFTSKHMESKHKILKFDCHQPVRSRNLPKTWPSGLSKRFNALVTSSFLLLVVMPLLLVAMPMLLVSSY